MILQINVDEINNLAQFLAHMETRVDDFTPPLTIIAHQMFQDTMDSFSSGGGSLGLSWEPLSEATIERMQYAGGKRAPGFGEGPTGNLFGGIHVFVRPFVAGVESSMPHTHLFESGKQSPATAMSAGGRVRVGGTSRRQPGREFLLLTDPRTEEYINTILDYALGEGQWAQAA